MDDDILLAFIIFSATMIAIALGVNAYVGSFNVEQKIYPEVEVLLNSDLANKQIVTMPTTVPGALPGNPTFACYVHNPRNYTQNVTANWWLSYQLPIEYVTISGYNGSFIMDPGNVTELVLSWSLVPDVPATVSSKFESAGSGVVHLEIIPSLVQ